VQIDDDNDAVDVPEERNQGKTPEDISQEVITIEDSFNSNEPDRVG
jgi:hypothetical protein